MKRNRSKNDKRLIDRGQRLVQSAMPDASTGMSTIKASTIASRPDGDIGKSLRIAASTKKSTPIAPNGALQRAVSPKTLPEKTPLKTF